MTRGELEQDYFTWMYVTATGLCPDETPTWFQLLSCLHNTRFYSDIPMDENRADDGMQLRYRFGRRCGYSDAEIADALDWRDASVLEVMLALAVRCEEHIMADPELGDRTSWWFAEMLTSMGLGHMDDAHYDDVTVDDAVGRMLAREYEPDGEGGLFTAPGCPEDLRGMELWYQMNWHLRAYGYV